MGRRTTLVLGIALVTVGLLGMVTVWLLALGAPSLTETGGFGSSGQRIYYTGLDADGRAIPRTMAAGGMMRRGRMGNLACVDCHGEDGRGGLVGMMMLGSVEIPDIRYSVLTTPHSEEGTTLPAWSDADIKRAVRDGIEPDGQSLNNPMPRWDMTDAELTDVIEYLKELDAR